MNYAPWTVPRLTRVDLWTTQSDCNHCWVRREPSYLDGVKREKCTKCKGTKDTHPPGFHYRGRARTMDIFPWFKLLTT